MTLPLTPQPPPPPDAVRLVRVAHCEGHTWWVSPTQRTIFYLDSLPPADTAAAIMQAVSALAEHEARPKLRLVRSVPSDQLAAS